MVSAVEALINAVSDWAKDQWPKIEVINTANGGWEGWAQVELYLYLRNNKIPGQTDITREVHVYTDKTLSADFEIRYSDATHADGRLVIELKTETDTDQENQSKGGAAVTFIQRVINESATVHGTELNGKIGSNLPNIPIPGTLTATLDGLYADKAVTDYVVIGLSASDKVRIGARTELDTGRYQHVTNVKRHELNPPGHWFGPLVLWAIEN